MSHVSATNPEDYVFSDVCGVIAYSLQISCDDKGIQLLWRQFRLLLDERTERVVRRIVHLVHLIVHLEYRIGHLRIAFDKGLQCPSNHRR